ncbi:MAG: peptide chain release factor subunit 1 [Gaiellaceae bacterium]|jgi:peptide chain release factor subunit 1|nr:peptide chain release factor subunit 1 [Gaiellaceae bacterium]
MATVVTEGLLRELAVFRATGGCAVSIYVDFDPSDVPTVPAEKTKFHARVDEAKKLADVRARDRGRDCRFALEADFERIRAWGDDEFDRDGARSLAVFASSADGFFRIVPLVEPVADGWEVGPELWIAPLAGQLGAGQGALVAVVSRERGILYRLRDGRLEEIADESEEVPGQHDQGGWSQARYQRHIENIVMRHLKAVGDEIDKTVHNHRPHLVVIAPDELRGEIESALSHEARESIVGWATADAHANEAELLALVRPFLDEVRAREDAATLERWQAEHGRAGKVAAGWKQTLDAASDARIDVLLVAEGARHPAWSCPKCGRASSDGGKCPLDDTKLEARGDAVDLAIHHTVLHGGTFTRFGAGALSDADGIGAILRF